MKGQRRRLLIAAASVAGVLVLWTGWQALGIRSNMNAAVDEVNLAREHAGKGDLTRALREVTSAESHIKAAKRKANGVGFLLLRPLPWVGTQARAVRTLTKHAAALTSDGVALLRAAEETPVAQNHELGLGVGQMGAIAAQLEPVREPLQKMRGTVADTIFAVDALQRQSLVGPLKRATNELDDALASVDRGLRAARAATVFVNRAAKTGPPMRLLFLAQDTWELRPSGGYIGSYGILEVGNGTLHLAEYADAVSLPNPETGLHPPDPFGSNLPHPWDLTGAGWWPDFPTSAVAAQDLFRAQVGREVDGVVGSTQQFIEDLLRAIGQPLQVPGYPDIVTPDNVAERILYNVELKKPEDVPRKKFLTVLSEELFRRLEGLRGSDARTAFGAFGKAFTARHLQLYFDDAKTQEAFDEAGWTGALKPLESADYFGWADADFDADKATKDVSRTINYTVTPTKDGRLVADVRILTKNDGEKTPINKFFHSYLRVYAPKGSTLVDADNHTTDVRADVETNLQTFGASQVIDPLSSGERRFVYYLPKSVVRNGRYRLVLRPQAGTPADSVNVTLNFGGNRFRQTFLAVDGDQLIDVAATGMKKHAATPGTWQLTPPKTIADKCRVTQPQPARMNPDASPQEQRDALVARQRALEPLLAQLRAQGCKQIYITYNRNP